MVETGFIAPFWLSLPAITLPFITAILILLRKSFRETSFTLLMLLSLLLSLKNLIQYLFTLNDQLQPVYLSLFESAEFVLLFLLFRLSLRNQEIKHAISYLPAIVLTASFTLHISQPNPNYIHPLSIFNSSTMLLLSIATLFVLIRNQYIYIFQSLLFWVAGGTLFYYSMVLAIEIFNANGWFEGAAVGDQEILLGIFSIMRLSLYLIGAIIQNWRSGKNEHDEIKNSSLEYPLR